MNEILVGRISEMSEVGVKRILVDRLWPRGVSKAAAPWDEWLKGAAPTTALRQWYGHRPERLEEFRERYLQELLDGRDDEPLRELRAYIQAGPVILLTATREVAASHVPILRDFLMGEA